MAKFRTLLKNRNFVLYSIGQAFSQFGDRLVQIVLIGLVYKRWPGSTVQLAKLFFFTVVPSFFISPIAGVYIDRWNKKHVMIVSDVLRAIAILLIPIFFLYKESIIPIYAIIFFIFASACFFLPARLSIIPTLVSKEDLLIANSASSITWVAAGIAGFSLGGLLAEWIGIRNSLLINALVYLLSATGFTLLLFRMRNGKKFSKPVFNPHEIKEVIRKSFRHDLIEGVKAIFFEKKIKFVVYIFFVFSSMIGAIYVVSVVFIQETLKSMTKYVGIFSMCLFAGLLVGSYIYGKIGQRFSRTKTIFFSLMLAGASINAFAVGLKIIQSLWAGCASAALLGLFISPIFVTSNVIIHECTESNLRGRIFSSIGIAMNLGFLLFMFLSSVLAEHIDRFWILMACGSGFSIFGLVNFLASFLKKTTFSSS